MLKAETNIQTEKAPRYLKALCNHFKRKVTAEYTDERGTVQFGFADCEMQAIANTLSIQIQAESPENFERVKYVVSDHLLRFSAGEQLEVVWQDQN